MEILYNSGISQEGSLIDLGVELAILKKSGSFYSYGEERIGQGRESVRNFLKTNVEISNRIETEIRKTFLP